MENMEIIPHQRQLSDVTRDIRRQAGQLVAAGIEIGRLLFEAKAMVKHGEWGNYLKTELKLSHSWANDYMRLYKEFGQEQFNLFAPDVSIIENWTATKAITFLRIPKEDRMAFLAEHDVDAMSVHQLETAIREQNNAEERAAELEDELRDTKNSLEIANGRVCEADAVAKAQRTRAEAAEAQVRKRESELEKLTRKYTDAKNAEAAAKRRVEQLKAHPEIPDSVMEAMRQQVEADEKAKAAATVQEALSKAQAELDVARRELENAREEAREARRTADENAEKLAVIQKDTKIQDPDLLAVQLLAQKLIEDWTTIQAHCQAAVATDPANDAALKGFLRAILNQLEEDLV